MEPQLLTVVDKDVLKSWPKEEWQRWQFEKKYDGARCLIVGGKPMSRTGKPLYNLDHILRTIKPISKSLVLDGEITGADWADTMSNARASKSERPEGALTFHAFDCLPLEHWHASNCPLDLHDRQGILRDILPLSPSVQLVVPMTLDSFDQFETFYALCVEEGCDGVVMKLKDSRYEFRRTKTWLKVKPRMTVDGVVLGMVPGKLKYEGTLGALQFQPEGSEVVTRVSGMTDEQRHSWWNNPSLIIGKTIEVAARGLHKTGRLIEPRFERIRRDK